MIIMICKLITVLVVIVIAMKVLIVIMTIIMLKINIVNSDNKYENVMIKAIM